MEALLLYRTGSTPSLLLEGFAREGVRLRPILWTPELNIEECGWGSKVICIYADKSKKMLSIASDIKKMYPQALVYVLEDAISEDAVRLLTEHTLSGYFARPWDYSRITHTIKTQVAGCSEGGGQKVVFGHRLKLDSNHRCLRANNDVIQLRNKEYELLEFLVMNNGRLVTRDFLIENVWDRNAKISSNTLDVHINRLRKKIEWPLKAKFIHTVHSIGYRFDYAE